MTRDPGFYTKPVYRPSAIPYLIAGALWVLIVFTGGHLIGWI
jgi:hypothetical protein